MAISTPKAQSVTEQGEADGWVPLPGFVRDQGPGGRTQLVVSVPTEHLLAVHVELVRVLGSPLGVLYRQAVDRKDPQPQGAPPRDFVGLDLPADAVIDAVRRFTDLLHHDARCELWIRGSLGDQIILDTDGLLFCQPDDPAFEDVLLSNGLVRDLDATIADRDYVKHLFHASNDEAEAQLVATLGLTQVPHRS
ncbi:MAG: hypothetical protein H6733_05770 [Alphaproteobacteria bacterium]|nr:hypothetical protein [Alphaproteobacteria bacterium]